MQIQERFIEDLREYENNPRYNEKAVEAVAESIKEFGFKVPIVIDSDGVIVAGHTRLKAARSLGLDKVPCIVADDLTPEQVKAFRLADNKTAELAEWNFELLENELAELNNFDMDALGFDKLPDILRNTELTDYVEDEVNEIMDAIEETVVKQGDIWQLGRHRLICGDSTDAATVERLLNGDKVDLLLTDPPYNVAVSNSDGLTIKNDDMEDSQFAEFLQNAFKAADNVMRDGAAFYIWHGDSERLNFQNACTVAGWSVRQCLIWVKSHMILGRQDYQWKHEPCLYGWKGGASHYFIKNRTQTTVIDQEINIEMLSESELRDLIMQLTEPSTILREDKPLKNGDHPTMKPIPLIKKQVKNSTRKNGKVLDIFGGSGTTLLACEELDRVCFMVEFDEKYCDVIIKRWEALTGLKAIKQ